MHKKTKHLSWIEHLENRTFNTDLSLHLSASIQRNNLYFKYTQYMRTDHTGRYLPEHYGHKRVFSNKDILHWKLDKDVPSKYKYQINLDSFSITQKDKDIVQKIKDYHKDLLIKKITNKTTVFENIVLNRLGQSEIKIDDISLISSLPHVIQHIDIEKRFKKFGKKSKFVGEMFTPICLKLKLQSIIFNAQDNKNLLIFTQNKNNLIKIYFPRQFQYWNQWIGKNIHLTATPSMQKVSSVTEFKETFLRGHSIKLHKIE